jgi:hypothetical protein
MSTMKKKQFIWMWAAGFAVVACKASTSHAADFAYEARLAAGYSDNIRRVPANEESETIASAGLRFSLDQVSTRIQAHSVADLAYFDYLDDTYDAELIGNLAAGLRFDIVEERFEWVVDDNFGQVQSDPFTPVTPDNRENINYFSTGPGFIFPIGQQNYVRLDGRYSIVSYEESPLDSDSLSAQLGIGHSFSSASKVSLNARREEIDFKDDEILGQPVLGGSPDYEQTEAFLQYEGEGARTQLTIDAGYTEITRENANSEDGLLFRLEASRRLSGASLALLRAGREFANSGTAFANAQESGSISLSAVPGRQSEVPFVHDYASLGWSFSRNRTSIGLGIGWSEDSYEEIVGTPSLNQTLVSVDAQFGRQVTSRLTLQLQARYGQGDFENGPDYEELTSSAGLTFQISRRVSLNVMYDYYDRQSDDPSEGTENRIWLSIGYGNGNPRRQYAPPEFAVDQRP